MNEMNIKTVALISILKTLFYLVTICSNTVIFFVVFRPFAIGYLNYVVPYCATVRSGIHIRNRGSDERVLTKQHSV